MEDIIMAKKLKLKEIEMDTMEILYYERQAARKRAYETKRRKKTAAKKGIVSNKSRRQQNSYNCVLAFRKAI